MPNYLHPHPLGLRSIARAQRVQHSQIILTPTMFSRCNLVPPSANPHSNMSGPHTHHRVHQGDAWAAPQRYITPPPTTNAAAYVPTVHEDKLKLRRHCAVQPTPPPPPVAPTAKQLNEHLNLCIATDDCIPSVGPFKTTIGKHGLMWPRSFALHHPAASLLTGYAESGCPVDCGPPWSTKHILLAIRQGPHKSALTKAARKVLHEETSEKLRQGYATVVKWRDIKNSIPPNLKISPVACIPHKSKPLRVIIDLSFQLLVDKLRFPSVNDTTTKLAPPEAMVQLGLSLKRIVSIMARHHNVALPFWFTKLDIKDGFWRLVVNGSDAWNFAYVLPPLTNKHVEIDDTDLVIPTSLQMGWCESPPFFCASSETARDVIQSLLTGDSTLPHHPLEALMLSEITQVLKPDVDGHLSGGKQRHTASAAHLPNTTSVDLIEVFVDDFIAATNAQNLPHVRHISRAMLHGVHTIYPPPQITKHTGADPIARKKLEKGDGLWRTEKEILGWIFDGVKYTMRLPKEKCERILHQIKKVLKYKAIPLKAFQELLGKFQHASFGIPGGSGFFSYLQIALKGTPAYITITPAVRLALEDWRTIIQHMQRTPTPVLRLVPTAPHRIGYSDACKLGCGGIWSPASSSISYTVWQVPFPPDIQQSIVTEANPTGTLTINDLELAGVVLQVMALTCCCADLTNMHLALFCDNTSAVSWTYKMRTSTSQIAARLLRLLGLLLLNNGLSPLAIAHIKGDDNDMADHSSRAFKHGKYFKAHNNLTQYFNTMFPLPQSHSWTQCTLPTALTSRVMSCLRGELSTMGALSRPRKTERSTGTIGQRTPNNSTKTPCSRMPQSSNKPSLPPPSLQGSEQVSTDETNKSRWARSQQRWHPSPRPSNWLMNRAPSTKTTNAISPRLNSASKE